KPKPGAEDPKSLAGTPGKAATQPGPASPEPGASDPKPADPKRTDVAGPNPGQTPPKTVEPAPIDRGKAEPSDKAPVPNPAVVVTPGKADNEDTKTGKAADPASGDSTATKPGPPAKTATDPTPVPQPAAAAGDDLVVIEELRAPAGSNCIQIISGERLPEIFVNKPKDGRFHTSDANGLCAIVYRRLEGAAAMTLSVDETLIRATADFATFGRGKVRLNAGDVARRVRDDFRTQMTYSLWLKSSASPGSANERRYVHELRR
ncbi:MAG TPA: hypothetical protein PK264_23385, partial [Hyphomicrobiaceae bacterium]|nr:hypothetical protein [Hyphomicrobiaceae bacterium]